MRYTVKQFNTDYPDDKACLDSVFENRYGDVKDCPKCGVVDTKFYRVTGRKCYACMHCGYQLHPLAQTIFHKSSTSLKDWFYAIYLFSVSKNGVSAKELERRLGVTYKTAHRMARQIRKLMEDGGDPLSGDIEIDETYIGGRRKMKQKFNNKSVVFGMVERNGSVKSTHVKSSGARVLLPVIIKESEPQSNLYSDEWPAYRKLPKYGYSHTTVNHSKLEYVRGTAHTNTIEGYWSQLKRSIDGTYHSVSPKHLQSYLNEFSFRYNFRGVAVYPVLLELASKRV
ncbi:MAG TPA: IS1595 family transposase [Candidatus Nitrosotenuis sp.]|nr:IS1595 family transposase [Candidatus Nitrosotenuis sp.]